MRHSIFYYLATNSNTPLVILDTLAQIAQVLAGSMLVLMAVYLQILAHDANQSSAETGQEFPTVPAKFRWPPFVIGVILLDYARDSTYIPLSDAVVSTAAYASFIYLSWMAFVVVLKYYEVPTPQERVKQLVDEVTHEIQDDLDGDGETERPK